MGGGLSGEHYNGYILYLMMWQKLDTSVTSEAAFSLTSVADRPLHPQTASRPHWQTCWRRFFFLSDFIIRISRIIKSVTTLLTLVYWSTIIVIFLCFITISLFPFTCSSFFRELCAGTEQKQADFCKNVLLHDGYTVCGLDFRSWFLAAMKNFFFFFFLKCSRALGTL